MVTTLLPGRGDDGQKPVFIIAETCLPSTQGRALCWILKIDVPQAERRPACRFHSGAKGRKEESAKKETYKDLR